MNKRINWIDICKFLSIWLVILLHYGVPSYIDHWVHYFHMPIFFFLSGLVFNDSKYTIASLIKSRLRTLIRPYIVFATLSYLFWNVIGYMTTRNCVINISSFLKCLLWNSTRPIEGLWGGIQWFLLSLFFTQIIFFAICLLNNQTVRIVIIITCYIVGGILGKSKFSIPWALAPSLAMIPFFYLGYLAKHQLSSFRNLSNSVMVIMGIGCAIIVTATLQINGVVNIREASFNNPFVFFIGASAGIFMLCFLSSMIDNILINANVKEWTLLLGKNTIILLYFHRWLQGVLLMIIEVLGIIIDDIVPAIVYKLFLLIMCALLSEPIIDMITRYFPWIIGREPKTTNLGR